MNAMSRIVLGVVYEPSSEEQRAAALDVYNARHRKRYELKRTARELGQLEGRKVRTVALVYEDRRRG